MANTLLLSTPTTPQVFAAAPIAAVRVDFMRGSPAAVFSELVGWDETANEFVAQKEGWYHAQISCQYDEVADGGSQATSAMALLVGPTGAWIRQDVQLPATFKHFYAGNAIGYLKVGEKIYADFTNATGSAITMSGANLLIKFIEQDGPF